MPTPQDVANLKEAHQRLKAAQEAYLAFIERPDRRYTPEESEENKRLLNAVRLAMSEYWKAFRQRHIE